MKLIRFGEPGRERPGIELDNGARLDLSGFGEDYDGEFFSTEGPGRLLAWISECDQFNAVDPSVRLGPPVKSPGKLVCIGLNFRKHAEESGMDIPDEPVIFTKAVSAICGPHDDLIIPENSVKTDWEVELAIVIGMKASNISREEADRHIAGYCLHNDYSERDFQFNHGGQWVKGKSCDTFAPLGPWMVTKEEAGDPSDLSIWLKVNDELMQNSSTSDFIFDVRFIVSYVSRFMTLLPGDIISTGTPEGVGMGRKPPRFIKAGDIIEFGIDKLGTARQLAVEYKR